MVSTELKSGTIYLRAGNYDEASKQFRTILNEQSPNAETWFWMGVATVLRGKFVEGDEYCRVLELDSGQIDERLVGIFRGAGRDILGEFINLSQNIQNTYYPWPSILIKAAGKISPISLSDGTLLNLNDIHYRQHGGYVLIFVNQLGGKYYLRVNDDLYPCPGVGCSMHEDWCTVFLEEPALKHLSPVREDYKVAAYLVKKSVFHHKPRLAISVGFNHHTWKTSYAFQGAVGIKAFKYLECRQRYLKEVAFHPADPIALWHDEYIDNYEGTAYY
jgi:hypothetical protein